MVTPEEISANIEAYILSGGRRTSASNFRTILNKLVELAGDGGDTSSLAKQDGSRNFILANRSTGGAYTIDIETPLVPAFSPVTGFPLQLKIDETSSGLCTLDCGTGVKKIYKNPTTQANSGDLVVDNIYSIIHDTVLDGGGWLIIGKSDLSGEGNETAASIGAIVNGAVNYTTPVDADKIGIWDTLNSLYKAVTWANIKATLKTYFDTFYTPLQYFGFGTLPAIVLKNTILYERNNIYRCKADPSYTPVVSLQVDFLTNWDLVSEGKKPYIETYAPSQIVDFSQGNIATITMTGNITSFTCSNFLLGHSYVIKFLRSGTAWTIGGFVGTFKSSLGTPMFLYTPAAWVSGTTYDATTIVSNAGVFYTRNSNTIGFNSATAPASALSHWVVTTLEDQFYLFCDKTNELTINNLLGVIPNTSNNLAW